MKREIKFRGRRYKGKWVYGDLEYDRFNGIVRIHTYNQDGRYNCQNYVDADTVGQYTGLKDRNGKEIYDGDIISVNRKFNKVIEYREYHAAFCMANIDDLGKNFIYPWQQINPTWWNDFKREILVIGNIHDNPELLEEKK